MGINHFYCYFNTFGEELVIMDLLACVRLDKNFFRLSFIHSVFKIESYNMPEILLKDWEYSGEQN